MLQSCSRECVILCDSSIWPQLQLWPRRRSLSPFSLTIQPNSNPEFLSPASGMFSHSQQFTVMGKTFTNITKNYVAAPGLPSDFRMIPMGDIDLRREIRVDECTGVVNSQPRERACVRRIHSAKAIIAGRKSRVTVAIYQGNGAEKEWRQDIAKYMSLRQVPFIRILFRFVVQLVQTVYTPQFSMMISYRFSRFWIIIEIPIFGRTCRKNEDFSEVRNYIAFEFHRSIYSEECTNWIRRSTGRLCTELTPANDNDYALWRSLSLHWDPPESPLSGLHNLGLGAETVTTFIDSLTLEQYHRICAWHLGQLMIMDVSAFTTVNLGAVFLCSGDRLEDSNEIVFLPNAEALSLGDWRIVGGGTAHVMLNGWTRFQAGDVLNRTLSICLTLFPDRNVWLAQANHIFRRLHVMPNFQNYVDPNGEDFDADIDPDGNSAHADDYESEYPPTLASDNPDLAVGTESVYYEGDVHDLAGENCGSEYMSNCEDHDVSELTVEGGMIAEEMPVPPPIFRIVLYMEFVAILFLALSWIYDDI
ncbi:hypothetical protein MSAN_02452500 [Mycena sanguinolenta]|uniref:Uncharacterized protein n=1 Tax=Mycena sanguinolenta TaxID=230812 RepID=A0A8H7CC20_9AGAR|nr:hypothetical protein MSAN_02452500 [Mycena sanguinolenta]